MEKLYNNKGITMISLVVTVIILSILTTISGYEIYHIVNDAKYYKAISQMKVMQAEVNEWYECEKNGEVSGWSQGVDVKPIEALIAYNFVKISNPNIGEYEDFKYFSEEKISEELDIDGINYDYIINIKTRSVILVNGINFKGETYYSLDELEEEQYNVKLRDVEIEEELGGS